MTDLLHSPGFLGTNANFAADMTLVMSILVALIFSVGYWLAKRGKYDTHKWVQTSGAILNIILVLWLMILPYRDFVVRDAGGPRPSVFYYATTIHATVGFFAFVFGNFVVLRGHKLVPQKLRFNKYKPYMRTAYTLYILTTLLGIWVYVTWFVTIGNPPVY
ncbi:MAG: DUF420 domain-containing protein [Chloroflexi bacterium]|nr:DUF420 domain-containing protein [Chloroflexota bacterium]